MNPSLLTDQGISCESPFVHEIRYSPVILSTSRNPFHHATEPEELCKVPYRFQKSKENTRSTDLPSRIPSISTTKSPLANHKKMKESQDSDDLAIPLVAFPYIVSLNKELAEGFRQISEQIPVLPCEIGTLSISPLPAVGAITLVVGLENTLVHFKKNPKSSSEILIRPYAETFLKELAGRFELIVYSAENKADTAAALQKLDPGRKYVKYVLDRSHCIQRDSNLYIKDLRILKGRSIEKIVIVDSSVFSLMGQLENGIYIPSFKGKREDTELLTVLEFLLTLKNVGDVRPIVKKFAGIIRAMRLFSKEVEFVAFEEDEKTVEEEVSEGDVGSEYE